MLKFWSDFSARARAWFEAWLKKAKGPLPGVYSIQRENLAQLACRRCATPLGGLSLMNTGGGSYISCPECQSRYYVKGR